MSNKFWKCNDLNEQPTVWLQRWIVHLYRRKKDEKLKEIDMTERINNWHLQRRPDPPSVHVQSLQRWDLLQHRSRSSLNEWVKSNHQCCHSILNAGSGSGSLASSFVCCTTSSKGFIDWFDLILVENGFFYFISTASSNSTVYSYPFHSIPFLCIHLL